MLPTPDKPTSRLDPKYGKLTNIEGTTKTDNSGRGKLQEKTCRRLLFRKTAVWKREKSTLNIFGGGVG